MAEDLFELMVDEQLVSASFIGHSLGGKTAMFFSSLHPEKTEKLVVSDIAPKFYPPHHHREIAALQSLDLESIHSRKEAEEMLRLSLPDEATIQFLLKNLYWKELEEGQAQVVIGSDTLKKLAWRFNLSAIGKNINAVGEALPADARFNKPTLFLRGEKSGYIKDQDIADIIIHFPKAEIKTITRAGHWIHAENPKEFMEDTLQFLLNS